MPSLVPFSLNEPFFWSRTMVGGATMANIGSPRPRCSEPVVDSLQAAASSTAPTSAVVRENTLCVFMIYLLVDCPRQIPSAGSASGESPQGSRPFDTPIHQRRRADATSAALVFFLVGDRALLPAAITRARHATRPRVIDVRAKSHNTRVKDGFLMRNAIASSSMNSGAVTPHGNPSSNRAGEYRG